MIAALLGRSRRRSRTGALSRGHGRHRARHVRAVSPDAPDRRSAWLGDPELGLGPGPAPSQRRPDATTSWAPR